MCYTLRVAAKLLLGMADTVLLGVLSYVVKFIVAEHSRYGLSFMWKTVE